MATQSSLKARQCSRRIEEKADKDLSEDALSYACSIIDKAGADSSNLSERSIDKVVARAEKWEENYYDFLDVQEQDE